MKWIGQHIVDFIARFRSDVYLDDISTGTIASGSNLGLDSNNKVVKATVSSGSGDITGVDLTAGEGITISDELNTDAGDYSATVGHADTSSQSSVNNSGRTFVQDLTLDDFGHVTGITSATDADSQVGTVTSFTVTTDSGAVARYTSSTTPNISIVGATGVGVTNSSGVITATAVPGEIDHDSLNNFVAAEHYDWASDNSGTATIHANNITDLHGAGVDGSDNQLLTDDGSGSVTSEANLTYDGTDLTAVSSSEGKPVLTLKTTHTTSNKSGELQFLKDAADTEDGESLGLISFYGEDEGNNNTKFAHIKGAIAESDQGAEGGSIKLAVATHDGEMINGLVINDGSAEDEIDVTIGSTATSVTTVAGDLVVTSDLTVNGDNVTFQSDNADDPKIVIQNNTNDAQGARLQMKKNRGAAKVNNDNIAEVDFFGEDAGQNQAQYAKLLIKANEVTDGQESGDFRVQVAAHDATLTQGLKLVGGSESGEVDVTIGAGANSLTSVEGSLQTGGNIELGHANDTTIARSASGVATIEGKTVVTRDKVIYIETSNFSDDINTDPHYIPFVTTGEHENFSNVAVPFVAPANGKLLGVHYKANNHTHSTSNTVTFRLDRLADGLLWSSGNEATIGTKVVDGVNRVNTCSADFQDLTTAGASGTNAFNAGEMIGVSLQNSVNFTSTKYSVTLVFEFDFNSY